VILPLFTRLVYEVFIYPGKMNYFHEIVIKLLISSMNFDSPPQDFAQISEYLQQARKNLYKEIYTIKLNY